MNRKRIKFIINQIDKIKYLQKCQTIQIFRLLEIKIINLLGQGFGVMKKDMIVRR